MNIYIVTLHPMYYYRSIVLELVAETEQDARIIAAHCCGESVKEVVSIECILEDYDGEPYLKTLKNERSSL